LPPLDTISLTGSIYAALHGAIDRELGGCAGGAKGLGNIEATLGLFFNLLSNEKRVEL
jgi:hypothetical protein